MTKQQALERVEMLSRKIAKSETSLEEWKWKRAGAMADAADAGATQREIASAAGCSQAEVGRHIKVARSEPVPGSTFQETFDAVTGFDRDAAQVRTDSARTKKTLTEAPMEQVEQIVAALPRERQQALAAAAGHSYLKARQEQDEAERRRTPAEQRERDEARDSLTRPVREATSSFVSLGIVGHLEQATDELRELNADASLTPQAAKKIERALDVFVTEFTFARAMLGEEADS